MKKLSRAEVVAELRCHLLKFVDDKHSICEAAARRGIFCHGFKQFTEEELRESFPWISGPRPNYSREDLEDVIDKYLVARREAVEAPLTCDAQQIDRDLCMGWDTFSPNDLAAFYKEALGEEVEVIADAPAGGGE